MVRATVVRALVLTMAFAAALTPVRCLGEDSNQLPTKATKELPPELLSLFRQTKMPKHSPILVHIFKEEAELEVWKQDTTGHFQILKIFAICRWSGAASTKYCRGSPRRESPSGLWSSWLGHSERTADPTWVAVLVAHHAASEVGTK
jgi:murein L,D-transpeptidase YafK